MKVSAIDMVNDHVKFQCVSSTHHRSKHLHRQVPAKDRSEHNRIASNDGFTWAFKDMLGNGIGCSVLVRPNHRRSCGMLLDPIIGAFLHQLLAIPETPVCNTFVAY